MKIGLSWLKQYVDINVPMDQYISSMVMIGNGIEGSERLDGGMEKVVVGHILEVNKHPNADSLVICRVDVGAEVVQIVTGAPNVKPGDYVPAALDGSILPDGKKIKAGKLRGEESRGMLCSGPELNVPTELYPHCGDEGILIFAEPHTPGEPVQPIFGIDDTVIDFEVLADRPDCLCVHGIARESAVAVNTKATITPAKVTETTGDIHQMVKITVEDAELCPRYCARAVRNIKIAPSPMWMKKALYAAGVRPINNIVDITNYVMLEMGQPMHAFDLDYIRGREIIVRRAKEGETLRTLDGKDRTLTEKMLVIADKEGATGLAGIMGGEGSEITENTHEVLLEAACFDRASIRQTGRGLGLRSESSGRFERGVSVHMVMRALDRAAELIHELGAGEVVCGVVDVYPNPKKIEPVQVQPDYIRGLTGVDIPDEDMKRILTALQMQVEVGGDSTLTVLAPDYRQDIETRADIAEEVLRVYGYDNIPSTAMRTQITRGRRSARRNIERRLITFLCGAGLLEIKTYSFQSPKIFDQLRIPQDDELRRCVVLRNPLGEDFSVMRTTLVGSMLQTLALNISRNNPGRGFFELNMCFFPTQYPVVDELPHERLTLALGHYGEDSDFYTTKGILEMILSATGLTDKVSWERSSAPYLHPGRSATLSIGKKVIAEVGEAHPDVLESFGINRRVVLAQMDIEGLAKAVIPMGDVAALPKYPAVTRDLALIMAYDTPAGDVMEAIRKAGGKLVEKVELFDVYVGAPIEAGYKSVAYSMVLRSQDHTLTEEEIEGAFKRALKAVQIQFDARMRE